MEPAPAEISETAPKTPGKFSFLDIISAKIAGATPINNIAAAPFGAHASEDSNVKDGPAMPQTSLEVFPAADTAIVKTKPATGIADNRAAGKMFAWREAQ